MRAVRWGLAAVVLAMGVAGASQAAERNAQFITLNVDQDGVARAGVEPSVPGAPVPAPASAAPALPSPPRGTICDTTRSPTPSEAEALVRKIATEESFYPDFVVAVAKVESHFHAEQVSPKGAIGLMQLMPATATRFGVDICDPAQVDQYRGVPPFPETVRYVASVLNEFYAWPLPRPVGPARIARARMPGAAAAQTATSSGWSQDFVLHVEE